MYRRNATGWLKHIDFMILDMLCLHVSFFCAYLLRQGWSNMYSQKLYANVALVLTFIELIVVIFFGGLRDVLKRGFWRELVATCKNVALTMVLLSFYMFTVQVGAQFSRTIYFVFAVAYLLSSYVIRILWKKHLHHVMREGGKRALLIITTYDMLERLQYNLENHNYEMFRVVGIVVQDRDMKGQEVHGHKIVANMDDVIPYVQTNWVDEVFFNVAERTLVPQDLVESFIEMGVVVHVRMSLVSDTLGQKRIIESLGKYTVYTATMNYASPKQLFFKRCLDIFGGILGCLVTGILFLVLAPCIYIQSPGPIFFGQMRVGKNGKKFKLYKFRSMYMDAEERKKELLAQNRMKDGMMFKLEWDPRIIGSKKLADGTLKKGIGNYIRDWSLDEFPQFYNVLKGDMSLVGTRPPTLDEWEKYEAHHRARLATKPGITGMWQVSGRSNITDFEEVVRLDKEYIENWSIGLDLRILFKTVKVVLKKDGSM